MHRRRLWIGIGISLVCLALALVGIEWNQVGATLHRADWRYLIPALGALLGFLIGRSIRWRILLASEIGLTDVFAITNIGYLVSNVLPFRLGDPARAVAIGLTGKVRTSAALSTVVVERVLDMLMVVLLLAFTLPFVGQAGWTRDAGVFGGAAAVTALAVLVVLAHGPSWCERALGRILAAVPRIDRERWMGTLAGLLDGLVALRSVRSAIGLLVWSLVTWASSVAFYFAVLRAFVERPSLIQASFLTCAVGLSVALPSSPGALGVFQVAARYALQLPFGVPAGTATATAFAAHALMYVSMCLLGLIGLAQQNLSLGRLRFSIAATALEE